jgi:hypothetical protein
MNVFREATFIANALMSARISFSCGYMLGATNSIRLTKIGCPLLMVDTV